ncbi:MAG: preprotein translocase subunit SecG [Hyphomicrobiaceae bacterium]|jgi:preprotein translocase subunit SecG|nr:preprotein translocase subunit SecG [Methyloceanibacter sp.]MDX2317449.1 preprotein translocase subunit SecG [Hyphomicrobiaceae bacterium]MDX2449469.1 preprotein translocase subunit SecG [Hyphomicrobiaceae bacterium]
MSTVLLLIHVMVAVALVGIVLLQRSEGGALGIGGGGGGGGGGFMTGRGAGSALTKTTAILAACFFVTSLSLSILASRNVDNTPSILPAGSSAPSDGGLAPLQIPGAAAPTSSEPAAPSAPQSE